MDVSDNIHPADTKKLYLRALVATFVPEVLPEDITGSGYNGA